MARKALTPEDARRGERLLALRRHFGLSQKDIYPENHTQVINAEKGRNKLKGRLPMVYARAFEIEPEQFLKYAAGQLTLEEVERLSKRIPRKVFNERMIKAIDELPLDLIRDEAAALVVREGFGFRKAERAVNAVVGYEPPRGQNNSAASPERLARLAIGLLRAEEELGDPPPVGLGLSDPPGARRRRR